MSAGGLDPYDDDGTVYITIELKLTRAELFSLNRMAKLPGVTISEVVQDIMRDVIADEMADQGGALPQEQRVTKCA